MLKNIVLDCDGVLYPLSELPTKKIVDAMKYVYRNDVKLSGEEQKFISEKTIAEHHLGMFNYIKEICKYKNYDFDEFCARVVENTDYSGVKRNKALKDTLKNLNGRYNIVIFSNNSRSHLNAICRQVFDTDIVEMETNGIKICDIKSTEYGGYFYPKQHDKGFSLFLNRMRLKSDETILFDDAPINITKAKEAGMRAKLISAENTLLKELQEYILPSARKGKSYGHISSGL